ncbi:MAG: hypothetical protein KatS3mg015_2008 [Fimbriimonadales bacterium]|nr:MAG: hypothetical protein KatS3mg015_2008 [Fimbriimonadales bacterium]
MKQFRRFAFAFALAAVYAVAASPSFGQDEFIPDPGQKVEQQSPQDKEKQDKIKKYEETIKDAAKYEGPFTIYQKEDEIYLELSPDQLGKYFFLQATLRTGADPMIVQAGMPLGNMDFGVDAFRFEKKTDDEVWLYYPNYRFRWNPDDPLAIAAQRSFPEAVLDAYKIVAENPDKNTMLIEVSDMFRGELFRLQEMLAAGLGRPFMLDRKKSRIAEVKAFPKNLVLRAELYFNSSGGPGAGMNALLQLLGLGGGDFLADPRSLPLGVTYNIYKAEESDYMPRLADPRIGYFTTDYYSLTRFMNEDQTERLIARWNLKKKDPNAPLSEPVHPIVWYIDDSVPEKWRQACADGILRWNKAFEAIGIKDAIQVKMKPKDADWDHADMRYNVLRFIQSDGAGYAIALLRTNPFTGEIVNASISVDSSMVSLTGQEWKWLTKPGKDAASEAFGRLLRNPSQTTATKPPILGGRVQCELGEQAIENAAFGWLALSTIAGPTFSINRDDYIKEFLRDVVSHEMGHCLGLRHNFIASTELSLKELADPSITEKKGISSSVMDYVPVNLAAVARGGGHYYSRTIGAYDMLAIRYGYADVPGKDPIEQRSFLMQIAAQTATPGHLYMTDENADQWDPFVTRFDLGKNPLEFDELGSDLAKKLMKTAPERLPEKGRPYSDLTRGVMIGVNFTVRQCLNAARFVGGLAGRRNFKGDPGEQPTLKPVDASLQREAIGLIAREMFSENAFPIDERVMFWMSGDPNSETYNDMPLKDLIGSAQMMILSMLWSADTVDRVANNEFKTKSDPNRFTLSELYGTVVGKIFSEIGTGRPVSMLRRDLQRFAVEALATQALAPAGAIQEDARMIAWDTLERLYTRTVSATSTDATTRMHLKDLARRIKRVLDSKMSIGR